MRSERPGITRRDVRHEAPAGRRTLETNHGAGKVQLSLNGPDRVVLTRRQHLCRLADGHPSDRHHPVLGHPRAHVDHGVHAHFGARTDHRPHLVVVCRVGRNSDKLDLLTRSNPVVSQDPIMLPQITVDRSAGVSLHQQLGDQLRRLILSGELGAGTRLPSSRRAAAELGVSRNVVVLAYEQLQLEGYLRSGVGVGTWVPDSLDPHLLRPTHPPRPALGSREGAQGSLSEGGERISEAGAPIAVSRPSWPFRPAAVAAELFPARTWVRLSARMWRTRTAELVQYGDVRGYRPLREQVAAHLARYRAVRCQADQVLMTAGSQQSLDLIGRMLIDPGDRAALEDPAYHGASASLEAAGAVLVPVPVDEQGLDPASLADATDRIRVLYTTPSHQYPLGVTMALERRLALLDWARRSGSWIIEDDYDSEFRFEARPLPALQGLDPGGCVIYVGTFSKVLAPALRVGFMVLPEPLVEPFLRAREITDHHPPIPVQATLAEFMAEGHLERHIARMRNVYAERRAALSLALREAFGDRFEIVPGDAGLHLTLLLGDGLDDTTISRLAAARSLDVQPLSLHYVGPDRRSGLVLGFGGFPPERLAAEVKTLRECVEEAGREDRRGS
jgi:GntR family transcriptional regulator / MocR family aminotransferase